MGEQKAAMGYALEDASSHPVKEAQWIVVAMCGMQVHAKKLTALPVIHSLLPGYLSDNAAKYHAEIKPGFTSEDIMKPERGGLDGRLSPDQIWSKWKDPVKFDMINVALRAHQEIWPNGTPSGKTFNESDYWVPWRAACWQIVKSHALTTAQKKKVAALRAAGQGDEADALQMPPVPPMKDGWRPMIEACWARWGEPAGGLTHCAFIQGHKPGSKSLTSCGATHGGEQAPGKGAVGRRAQREQERDDNPDFVDPKKALLQTNMTMARMAKRNSLLLQYAAETEVREAGPPERRNSGA